MNYFLHLMDAEVIKKGKKLFRWDKEQARFIEFTYDPRDQTDFPGVILIDRNHQTPRSFTKVPSNLDECVMRTIIYAGIYYESTIWMVWQGKEVHMKSSELVALVEPIERLEDRIRAVVDLMK